MKNKKVIAVIAVIVLISVIVILILQKNKDSETSLAYESDRAIIPKPLNYEKGEGNFILTENTSIYVKGKTDEETEEIYKIAEYIRDKMKPSTGFNLNIIKSDNIQSGSIYLTTIEGEESEGNEGYKIVTKSDSLKLVAYKSEGLFRAVQTLRQLLPSSIEKDFLVTDTEWEIPISIIEDKPEYEYRGLMIDVARHFFSVEDIKRQIDLAVQYKINKLHLHLSDDQGWRLEIKKWPDLTKIGGSTKVGGGDGGYYTQEEFKELVRYAKDRYVEVIPEFDMPGHTNAALASYGFLNKNGQKKDLYTGIEVGFSSLLCRDEETYNFIDDVIKEISEISPSQYIHIGGDEPHSTEKSDYDYFIGRVIKIVEKYGKKAIGWNPSETSKDVGSDLILQSWSNTSDIANEKKMKTIVSIAGKAYLDMKYDSGSKYGLTWAGFNPIDDAYNWDPTNYTPKDLVLGIEAPLWTETISDSKAMDYMIYPRLLGHAEIGWTPKEARDWNEYKERLIVHGKRMKNEGINYYADKHIWK